jgi:hypothetical protein
VYNIITLEPCALNAEFNKISNEREDRGVKAGPTTG